MFSSRLFILVLYFVVFQQPDKIEGNEFPKDFLFGLATASYQTEGGWDKDGWYLYFIISFYKNFNKIGVLKMRFRSF